MKNKAIISLALSLILVLSAAVSVFAAGSGSFGDVAENHWAVSEIERAYQEHVIEGSVDPETGIRNFRPESPLSYAAFATIMIRAAYPGMLEQGEAAYPKDWVLAAGYAAEKLGLIDEGMSREKLDSPMPRYDMARLLINLLLAFGRTDESLFDIEAIAGKIQDGASLKPEYRDCVAMCYDLGLISGFSDGSFKGDNRMNRAQAAAVYCRYSDLVERIDAGEAVIKTPAKAEELPQVNEDPSAGEQPSESEQTPITEPPAADGLFSQNSEFELECIKQILDGTNAARAEEGLKPLFISEALQKAAFIRSRELEDHYSHTRPDGSSCDTAIEPSARYSIWMCGENIAAGHLNGSHVMEDWMASPGHRSNILEKGYTCIGIGAYVDAGGMTYYVQVFGNGLGDSVELPAD